MKLDLDDKTDVLAYHKKLLAEALKEKEDLKTKFENWQNSFKNLSKLLNTQMSANDKFGLRFADEMHAVPPPMTGNYMPSGPNVEIDYSKFTYDPKQTLADESDSKPSDYASCESDSSVETSTSMPEPVENASKVVCEPKVWTNAPIIEEYESDSDNNSVPNVQEDKEKPSFAFTDSVKMVKQAEFTKNKNKVTAQRENRPIWNNVQRVNHQNKFVPSILLTKTGKFPVNAARENYSSQAASISTASKVNTARPFVNETRPNRNFWNTAHLVDYQEFKGGYVAFGCSNGRIIGKGKLKNGRLDFEDVYYVEELKHYNLFPVPQMCDKKNKVLFTKTDCLVLSLDFKLPDENQVLLKIHTQHNMYSFNLKNIDPSRDLACLFVKASIDESNKWHRRLGHVNFKNLNKLMKGNLVRGLPFKIFENDHTCVACQKQKQHKASCKAKTVSSGNQPLQILHMDIFGPTSVRSINHMTYCLVITDGFSRSDNGTEFKNKELTEFCGLKEIKREYCNARTPQQNGVVENKTLIEAARTMLADLFLPTTFWAEPVSQVEQVFLEELEKLKRQEKEANDAAESLRKEATHDIQNASTSSTNLINSASTPLSTAGPSRAFNDGELSYPDPFKYALLDNPSMPHLEVIYASLSEEIFTDLSYDDEGVVTDFNNLEITKQQRNNHKDFQHCLFACFLSQIKPKKISQALEDESWVDAMQEELL
nr:putative ribonuclease H-like domain-containing protein [Tanacetum cinerariifolium]